MKPPANPRRVVVFGGSSPKPGDEEWEQAESLGRAIAASGWSLVTGGYGGVMEAASAGARSEGGEVVGVLCKVFGGAGNRYLTRRIVSPDLYSRLQQLVDLGDAYVALPGSTGTLVELAMVWELMNKRLVALRPIYCLGEFWRPVVSMFSDELTHDPRFESRGLPDRKGGLIEMARSPDEIIRGLSHNWN